MTEQNQNINDNLSSTKSKKDKIKDYLRMIKIEHSVFALPFALIGFMFGIHNGGTFSSWTLFWVIVAMVSARSGAMGFNRVVDSEIDSKNPRTANREIPNGTINIKDARVMVVISFLIFWLASYMIQPVFFFLAPIIITVLAGYSYTKRFTHYCHFVLGLALGLAPFGAYVSVTGQVGIVSILLCLGVLLWTAGFDILYSLQDKDFDVQHGLHSIPVKFGNVLSIDISKKVYIASFVMFLLAGFVEWSGIIYYIGVLVAGYLMYRQHQLVKPNDLSKIDIAFFNMNAYIAVVMLAFTSLDLLF